MPDAADEILHERIWISGPRRLAGELAYPADSAPLGSALLLNPHPYMGGSMRNNVIENLHSALARCGLVALRFDYSGVGESEGQAIDLAESMAEFWRSNHAPTDELMIEDALAARETLRGCAPAPVHLAGYSFGCHVAVRVLEREAERPASLTLVSPTIAHHGATFAPGFSRGATALMICSDNDFATPINTYQAWLDETRRSGIDRLQALCIAGGQHFFLGQEDEIAAAVSRVVAAPEVAAPQGVGT